MINKLFTSFLKFSFGGIVAAFISFAALPFITDQLNPDEYGRGSMYLLAYHLLLNLSLLGLDQSFVRYFYAEDYKESRKKLLINTFVPVLIFASFLFLLLLAFWQPISNTLVDHNNFELIAILAAAIFFGVNEKFTLLIVRMSQRGVLFSMLRIVQSITNVGVTLLYLYLIEDSFIALAYGSASSALITFLIALYFERENFSFESRQLNKQDIKSFLRYGLPFLPTFIIVWIFQSMDKFGLRYFSDFNEIGFYSAAFKIVSVLTILQTGFTSFWTPIAFETYEKSTAEGKALFSNVFRGLSSLLLFAGLMIIIFRDVLIILFDSEYGEAAATVPFLVFIPVMYTMSEITVGGINFKNKTSNHLWIAIAAAIVNLIGVIILVPAFGARGAALSTGIAYVVFFYARTLISVKYYPIDFKLMQTSNSIVIVFIVAYFNTFYADLYVLVAVDLAGILGFILINFKDMNRMVRKILRK
ncbi:MAG: oligosaccharide flippase family protein [Cyclobacteriaceae bacterium]